MYGELLQLCLWRTITAVWTRKPLKREGGGGKESAWKYHLTPNCPLKIPVVHRPSCLLSRIELVCLWNLKEET